MSKHVMVDLESMSVRSNAVITSIGAVSFDEKEILEEININISFQEQIDKGHHIRESTIRWWMRQNDDAQAEFDEEAVSTLDALDSFRDFLLGDGTKVNNVYIWGNGAGFDNVALKSLYHSFYLDVPWKFYNDRCYRTVKNIYSEVQYDRGGEEVAHIAVDDARAQARHLMKIVDETEMELA